MSSALQPLLTNVLENNYASLVVLTALVYDHALTFSKEIEYVWCEPWTWVSIMFVLVRYVAIYGYVIPGTCEIVYTMEQWGFLLFLGIADLVMILRVWAMYNRSRLILGVLLTSFSVEIVFIVVISVILSIPKNQSTATVQILNFSFCAAKPTSVSLPRVATILQIVHGTITCALAIVQFIRQSLRMYRATKQWKLNRYTNLLVRQGILYFIAFFLSLVLNEIEFFGLIPGGWGAVLCGILDILPAFVIAPRFILSIRELYARSVQGGYRNGIDTGFGLSSYRGAVDIETEILFAGNADQDKVVEGIPREGEMMQSEHVDVN